jgi:hypothetical protein
VKSVLRDIGFDVRAYQTIACWRDFPSRARAYPFAIQWLAGRLFIRQREREALDMSDRGALFVFSIFMIVASVAAVGWLIVTGQALTVDGLFLVLTALLSAAVFGLYVKFVIGRAMDAQVQAAKQTAKAAKAEAKPAPAPVAQS